VRVEVELAAGDAVQGSSLRDEAASPRSWTLERFQRKRGDIHPKHETKFKLPSLLFDFP